MRLRRGAGGDRRRGYSTVAHYNGQPAAGIGIRLAAGANALDTATAVRQNSTTCSAASPGVRGVVPTTTPFVHLHRGGGQTLIEAVVLVFLVMYLFPPEPARHADPHHRGAGGAARHLRRDGGVRLLDQHLTMFGMVLAIGLLVDDAIVVVENVERVMTEEGLPPKEATKRSMGQITGALVGIGLVLSAVFVPMAFFGGSTG